MNVRFLILGFAVAVATVGCTKVSSLDSSDDAPISNEISFGDSALTRGDYFNEIADLADMRVYAYYTAQESYDPSGSYDYFMHNQMVEQNGSTWSYSPVKYWSNNDGDKFTFFAFAPADALCTFDESTNSFDYTLQQYAKDNDDLLVAATYNQTKTTAKGKVRLQFKHALQRLSLYGAVTGKAAPKDQLLFGETNVRYVVNGSTLNNIYSEGKVSVTSDDEVQWSDVATKSLHTATQGETLLAFDDPAADLKDVTLVDPADRTSSNYTPVNAADKGIFVLPQTLDDATVQMRVRKIFDLVEWLDTRPSGVEGRDFTTIEVSEGGAVATKYVAIESVDTDGTIHYATVAQNKELIYETDPISLPAGLEWKAGAWINLLFTFDVSQRYAMPMTVTSEMYDWTEADVDVVVNSNIYVYTSGKRVAITPTPSESYGEFLVCTNYTNNLRLPHHRVELDGAITSSRGLVFISDDFVACDTDSNAQTFTYSVGKTDFGEDIFIPTLIDSDGNEYPYVTRDNVPTAEKDNYTYCNNGFAYTKVADGEYRLNYFDPNSNAITPFNYVDGAIDLSGFADSNNRVNFKIKIGATDGVTYTAANPYSLNFSALRTTRQYYHLYTNTSAEIQAHGINKTDSDAVYVLRLSVDEDHLTAQGGSLDDAIGVEMVSNGGGYITSIFDVSLYTSTQE